MDDLVKDGRHLAKVLGGEDGVEHLALPLVLLACCATPCQLSAL